MGGIERMLCVGAIIWLVRAWGRRVLGFLRRHVFIVAFFFCLGVVRAQESDPDPAPVVVTDAERMDALISAAGFLCGIQLGKFVFQLIRPV